LTFIVIFIVKINDKKCLPKMWHLSPTMSLQTELRNPDLGPFTNTWAIYYTSG